jgi:lipopolysaccharide export system protein LptC
MLKYLFFICLLICSYLFYHWVNTNEKTIQETTIEALPTFIAKDIKSKMYNNSGDLFEILSAQKAEFYKSIDMTDLTVPSLHYIPAKDTSNKGKIDNNNITDSEIWHLSAKHGVLNSDDSIYLRDDVVVTNTNTNSLVQKITSSYLELDFSTNEIRTPERINIEGTNFKNNGLGFNGNLNTKYFTINEDCHANYFGFTSK